jgi:hypothetical protein
MSLVSRIFTYFVGIALGSLLVYVLLFRGREDRNIGGWLPGARVLTKISESHFSISPQADCMKDCLGISEQELKASFSNANVIFSKSEAKTKPCPVYYIEATINQTPSIFNVEVCDTISTLRNILFEGKNCGC